MWNIVTFKVLFSENAFILYKLQYFLISHSKKEVYYEK